MWCMNTQNGQKLFGALCLWLQPPLDEIGLYIWAGRWPKNKSLSPLIKIQTAFLNNVSVTWTYWNIHLSELVFFSYFLEYLSWSLLFPDYKYTGMIITITIFFFVTILSHCWKLARCVTIATSATGKMLCSEKKLNYLFETTTVCNLLSVLVHQTKDNTTIIIDGNFSLLDLVICTKPLWKRPMFDISKVTQHMTFQCFPLHVICLCLEHS